MTTSLKLSGSILADTRNEASLADRSITGQAEHWMKLGRAVERILPLSDVLALKGWVDSAKEAGSSKGLRSRVLAAVERAVVLGKGKEDVRSLIDSGAPVYESDPAVPGGIVQIAKSGTRTPGRFKGRKFVPAKPGSTRIR